MIHLILSVLLHQQPIQQTAPLSAAHARIQDSHRSNYWHDRLVAIDADRKARR